MPFIGNKPSAVPLTSADIADGIITSAKIVDGTIVNADINASAAIASTKLSGVGATAGQVIQVVSATDNTSRSTSSTTYVTGSNTLSVTITPSASANKILIITNHFAYNTATSADYTIFRGATNIGSASGRSAIGYFDPYSGAIDGCICYTVLDSPNTTSATTYQVYMKASSGTTYCGSTNFLATITALEIKG
jgi:hypothetical protein